MMELSKDFVLIKENSFDKSRKEIRKNKNKKVIFCSDDDELNRKILEKEDIQFLMILFKNKKDKQKQRDSGFNHVMAKICKKKNVSIGINFDEIIMSKGKEKSEILGRLRQNISLCKKNKIQMKFITLDNKNKRDKYDLKSLGLVLGMPTWMIKDL